MKGEDAKFKQAQIWLHFQDFHFLKLLIDVDYTYKIAHSAHPQLVILCTWGQGWQWGHYDTILSQGMVCFPTEGEDLSGIGLFAYALHGQFGK